jgi:hypothetical protein
MACSSSDVLLVFDDAKHAPRQPRSGVIPVFAALVNEMPPAT